MTTDDDFDLRLEEYLESGPAELADRVLLAARAQLSTTRRRRAGLAWFAPWRNRNMMQNTRLMLAGGGAIVAVIGAGVLGASLLRPDGGPGASTAAPAPRLSALPEASSHPDRSPSLLPARAPAWTATGTMITPRSGHLAVRLLDGRVLALGGPYETITPSNAAELYDPASGTWAGTGTMLAPRFAFTATRLGDGRVLVAGGAGLLASAELFDPVTGTWTATGAMETARYDHTATLLRDGKVLVAGGIVAGDSVLDARPVAELYDPVRGTWTATGAMAAARYGHTATLLADGGVLVTAGFQDGFPEGPYAELYDPIGGTWTGAGTMIVPTPRGGSTATLLPDGRVLVVGGAPDGTSILSSAELYDPQTGAWSATQRTTAARSGHTATLLPDGMVLIAGGNGSADENACQCHAPLESAELFDPVTGTWSATASMIAVRTGHTATLLPDGRVLVASGNGLAVGIGSVVLASAELYDPGIGQ